MQYILSKLLFYKCCKVVILFVLTNCAYLREANIWTFRYFIVSATGGEGSLLDHCFIPPKQAAHYLSEYHDYHNRYPYDTLLSENDNYAD
jgi:hypothetical protein